MKKVMDKRVCALIVAAGKGTRMKMDMNKQYIEIGGKPVLARTVQVFEDCGHVDEIVIVVNARDIMHCRQNIVERYGFGKVGIIVAGGDSRQQSVYNGLNALNDKCGIVLIHDGARPFIDEDSIINSIEAAGEFGGACVAVPVKDTIKFVGEDGFIDKTLERSRLWSIQTPQTFRFDLILNAYKNADAEGFIASDDAMIAERMGHAVRIVPGTYYNIKITTEEDILLAEAIATREI
jgi:2-C-methyl-D-erythritol 4-phosphate cytidylyltransferase